MFSNKKELLSDLFFNYFVFRNTLDCQICFIKKYLIEGCFPFLGKGLFRKVCEENMKLFYEETGILNKISKREFAEQKLEKNDWSYKLNGLQFDK